MSPDARVRRGMWRHADRLPVDDPAHIVSLGEGDTPLLDLSATLGRDLGVGRLLLKAEDRNPTGSFKARIASVAASLVRERGLTGLVGTSSGNGGAAAAAYAAAAGCEAVMFTLSDTVELKMLEIVAAGGIAYRVHGVGHDAASTRLVAQSVARAATGAGFYPMLTGFSFAPEAMAGVQTIAYELSDEAPDTTAVYAPVGGGGLLTGLGRGFAETARTPRLVGVHPEGARALERALEGDPGGMDGRVATQVSGLQMAVLYDPIGAAAAIVDSGGHRTGVADEHIAAVQRRLAREHGLLVEPAGATALSGVIADAEAGRLGPDDAVVAVVTGAGYKDLGALRSISDLAPVVDIAAEDVAPLLAKRSSV